MLCCQDAPCVVNNVEATGEWITSLDQGQSCPSVAGEKLGMVVTFERPDGHEQDILFTHRPLGIDCSGQDVVVVERVLRFSHAANAGVDTNWVVRAVNGIRANVLQTMQGLMVDLPQVAEITLTFRIPQEDDKVKEIVLDHRPVGITFTRTEPLRVKSVKPSSDASRYGVRKGWILVQVDGRPIPERFEDAMEMVTYLVSRLPDQKATPR
eukprot:symbB.v1.2.030863.t2/scaffold3521.1/size54890/8